MSRSTTTTGQAGNAPPAEHLEVSEGYQEMELGIEQEHSNPQVLTSPAGKEARLVLGQKAGPGSPHPPLWISPSGVPLPRCWHPSLFSFLSVWSCVQPPPPKSALAMLNPPAFCSQKSSLQQWAWPYSTADFYWWLQSLLSDRACRSVAPLPLAHLWRCQGLFNDLLLSYKNLHKSLQVWLLGNTISVCT